MDIEFNSIKELYERLLPALNTKISELKRYDLDYIKSHNMKYINAQGLPSRYLQKTSAKKK